MLAGDFFSITSVQEDSGKINAQLEIKAGHSIFEGHFPGQPVVPGVCMMQLVKEIIETVLGRTIRLESASQVKFLTVMNPVENSRISADIRYTLAVDGKLTVVAALLNEATTYFKMNAVFALDENE